MKKRNLLLGLGFLGSFSMFAASPYQGVQLGDSELDGVYLYQVESGHWLQNNNIRFRDNENWTTYAQLGEQGYDVKLIPLKNEAGELTGWQIDPKHYNNHSLNGGDARFFTDTGHPVTNWAFEAVANGYRIKAQSCGDVISEEKGNQYYIGATDGLMSDAPTDGDTWQVVTRDERIEQMKKDVKNGKVDATWLVPGYDMGNNDEHFDKNWTRTYVDHGSGMGSNDAPQAKRVFEAWHAVENFSLTTKLTGLPNGKYEFTVQAYYRDQSVQDEGYIERVKADATINRAYYYAGLSEAPVMPLHKGAKTVKDSNFYHNIIGSDDDAEGLFVPDNLSAAAWAFYEGNYWNEPIVCNVTDGTLVIGIKKPEFDDREWLVYGGVKLTYLSDTPDAEDLSKPKAQLQELISKAKELRGNAFLTETIANAEQALASATSGTALLDAYNALNNVYTEYSAAKSTMETYDNVKAKCGPNVDYSFAEEKFAAARDKAGFDEALKELRYNRRRAVADRHEDVFAGNAPAAGKFYLYNVGQKQFLCGGSDWGAHAALGFPGVELTLEPMEGDDTGLIYKIETGLYNGEKHHLNDRGYMDTPGSFFYFKAVEGEENVYYILQNDWRDACLCYNPHASTDAKNNDETTVSAEQRGLFTSTGELREDYNPDNNPYLRDIKNAKWKLVSREDRDALMENASLENPVDITYRLASPNFNQREDAYSAWNILDFAVWEYNAGNNHNDYAAESWNTSADAELSQIVTDIPAGIYSVTMQGYYRNGHHGDQPRLEKSQNAYLYASEDIDNMKYLPNITEYSNYCPGECDLAVEKEPVEKTDSEGNIYTEWVDKENGARYYLPNSVVQATQFFKAGAYKVNLAAEVLDGEDLPIGVYKETKGEDGDWIVADNFRVKYYGKNTTKDAVEGNFDGIEDVIVETPAQAVDNRIFNLQGIEVKNPSAPGIYIQGGKKFILR